MSVFGELAIPVPLELDWRLLEPCLQPEQYWVPAIRWRLGLRRIGLGLKLTPSTQPGRLNTYDQPGKVVVNALWHGL